MRKISYWARSHKRFTWFIFVFLYLFINLLGLFIGDLLFNTGLPLQTAFIYIPICLLLAGMLLYPNKHNRDAYTHFYERKKTADFLLALSTILLVIFGGNRLNQPVMPSTGGLYASSLYTPTTAGKVASQDFSPNVLGDADKKPASKKSLRKQFKHKLYELRKHYREASKGEKVALIILASLVALGLLALLAALSCEISCSGSEALAIVVGLAGTALIVFTFVRVVQRITRGPRVPKETGS